MKSTAFDKLRKFCLYYIKQNIENLKKDKRFDEDVIKEIKNKNVETLDWFLSEIVRNEFLEKEICLKADWDNEDEHFVCIYKIGSTYIKTTFVNYKTDIVYEFVKKKKKKIIVYEWVSK